MLLITGGPDVVEHVGVWTFFSLGGTGLEPWGGFFLAEASPLTPEVNLGVKASGPQGSQLIPSLWRALWLCQALLGTEEPCVIQPPARRPSSCFEPALARNFP